MRTRQRSSRAVFSGPLQAKAGAALRRRAPWLTGPDDDGVPLAEAVEYQKKAVALAENDGVREQLTEALKRYEAAAK